MKSMFLVCRYVSVPESLWRIYEYHMTGLSHSIFCLNIYLPNGHRVFFQEGEEQADLDCDVHKSTHLTAWFQLNSEYEAACQYYNLDIPEHFVFKKFKWQA